MRTFLSELGWSASRKTLCVDDETLLAVPDNSTDFRLACGLYQLYVDMLRFVSPRWGAQQGNEGRTCRIDLLVQSVASPHMEGMIHEQVCVADLFGEPMSCHKVLRENTNL